MGVTNMNAIFNLTDEKQSLFYKFGGLFGLFFLLVYIPASNYVRLNNELKKQQNLHQEYVNQTSTTIGTLSNQLQEISSKYQKTEFFKSEVNCLADNIYHEIGVDSEEGMRAVAQVTLNRKREGFANTICGVVHQKNGNVCQFSWFCTDYSKPNLYAYRKAYNVAKNSLINGIALSKLSNALYYHADYIKPSWYKEKLEIAHIGPHIFYAEKGN